MEAVLICCCSGHSSAAAAEVVGEDRAVGAVADSGEEAEVALAADLAVAAVLAAVVPEVVGNGGPQVLTSWGF